MLFIYVYFLFQMSPSVTVLFLAGPAGSLDEKKRADRIVGAVSAQTFLRVFQRQCPWFSRVSHFDTPAAPPDPQRSMFDRLLEAGVVPGSDFFNGRLNSIRYFGSVPQTYREVFTKNEVREWFGSSLSKRTVNADLEDASLRSIRRALRAGTSM